MGLECETTLADYSLKESQFFEAQVAIDFHEMPNHTVLSGKLGASFKKKKSKKVTFLPNLVQVSFFSLIFLHAYVRVIFYQTKIRTAG